MPDFEGGLEFLGVERNSLIERVRMIVGLAAMRGDPFPEDDIRTEAHKEGLEAGKTDIVIRLGQRAFQDDQEFLHNGTWTKSEDR
jgi:hypothetical protein